jgi:hypothetical protein
VDDCQKVLIETKPVCLACNIKAEYAAKERTAKAPKL